jgi:4a-hydroxytetrahydrobiopterin dehydratase
MDMLMSDAIHQAGLREWRMLAQGLHARYLVEGFAEAVTFIAAVGEAGDAVRHYPRVAIGDGFVDLELVSQDAIYRDEDDGSELVVEWVTQQDVDLARRISEIAAEHGLEADPTSVSEVELGLRTAQPGTVAPVWAALLTGNPEDQGRGQPGDEIRDSHGRLPNLWFDDPSESADQRVVVEVYVAAEVVDERLASVVAAGGSIVDDSQSPGLTVVADHEGNRGVLCASVPPA